MAQPVLEVKQLQTYFFSAQGTRVVKAVDGVSFTLNEGETLGVVGESGSGKTVTSMSLLRLLPPAARIVGGEVWFQGENLLTKSEREMRDRVAELLSKARRVRVTGPAGTDVEFSVEGRRGNSHPCIVDRPGVFTGIPNIEANISPVEGTAEGMIVFDASIPNLRSGTLAESVRLTVEKGVVVKIEGGRDAKHLERMWAAQNDPNGYDVFSLGPDGREGNDDVMDTSS